MSKPNVIFVFGDQWRAQATGYAGDPNVKTPNIDALAAESVNVTHAIAGCPVCSPYRASLLTGQYPLTHGVFLNDVHLAHRGPGLGDAFKACGYDTAYIGKWHVDGRGRDSYIPPEDRQGFDYFKVLECTHSYNHSMYYANDSDQPLHWEGYDAEAQTRDAVDYLRKHDRARPVMMVLSWGPPHNPYQTAPERFRAMYDPARIQLRANVPPEAAENARQSLAGYYAHCTALDEYLGTILQTLRETGQEDNTIFVFTSDHGDMIRCHGLNTNKQGPWDESIRVPFLIRYPAAWGRTPRTVDPVLNAPDLMPTLLGLAGCPIPVSVEGHDFSKALQGEHDPAGDASLIACYHPIADWWKGKGGRDYRGVRTRRYTYTRDHEGPWLLFDNEKDPYQMTNVVNQPAYAKVQAEFECELRRLLAQTKDEFKSGLDYIREWGYPLGQNETVPCGKK
jgi:arylsulfatase A-like enzyme